MNWFILALKKTFDFKGRARRKEFGWFQLIYFLILLTFDILEISAEQLGLDSVATLFSIISGLFGILTIITPISLTTRRLHDLGYSGWLQLWISLIIIGVFSLGFGLSYFMSAPVLVAIAGIVCFMTAVGFLLLLLFTDGQPHSNKYGESPKYLH